MNGLMLFYDILCWLLAETEFYFVCNFFVLFMFAYVEVSVLQTSHLWLPIVVDFE
jgi:hypothetical protein